MDESTGSPAQDYGRHQIVTVQQHIMQRTAAHAPAAAGVFSWLLSGITLATKMTQAKVRRAGLLDVLGAAGQQQRPGRSSSRSSTSTPTKR